MRGQPEGSVRVTKVGEWSRGLLFSDKSLHDVAESAVSHGRLREAERELLKTLTSL